MKIKSILAGVVAAGAVCAVSATAFAEDVVLVSAPETEDIYIAPGETVLGVKVAEQFNKLFGDQMEAFAKQIQASIEAAGGVDAIVDNAMEQIEGKTPDELKAAFEEQLKQSGVSEEQINIIMEFYNSKEGEAAFTPEMYRNTFTALLTSLQSTEGAGAFIESIIMMFDEATLQQLSEALDAYEAAQAGAGTESGTGSETGKGEETTGGDNADTGVEGVAAVVGVITVAGAAVVISRKRA